MLTNSHSLMATSPLHLASRTKCNASLFLLSHQSTALLDYTITILSNIYISNSSAYAISKFCEVSWRSFHPELPQKLLTCKMFNKIVIV